jgi:uncharacterized membrane protein YccF (DUF307 family)
MGNRSVLRLRPILEVRVSVLSLLLNLLWILFGGLWMAVGWAIAAVIMVITIIGLPWARAAFSIAVYTLLPFGQKAVSRAEYFGQEDIGTGPLGIIGNLVWLVLAGWWLALGHLVIAVLLALTIVGIPFAWAHLKLAGLALWPIGKVIVPVEAVGLGHPPWR